MSEVVHLLGCGSSKGCFISFSLSKEATRRCSDKIKGNGGRAEDNQEGKNRGMNIKSTSLGINISESNSVLSLPPIRNTVLNKVPMGIEGITTS